MSVSKNLVKTKFLKIETSTSTRLGRVKQKHRENGVKKIKTWTSTRMGHVGEQKHCENEVFGNKHVDIMENGAYR